MKTFFRTNKGTCKEWVRRLRLSVATVALHAGQNAVAVEQGYQLLKEMSDSDNTSVSLFSVSIRFRLKFYIFFCYSIIFSAFQSG